MTHPAATYRPDIDGLRAVAVLLVVLYHAQIGLFPGGYIGVDVFFVISGYLITGIIAGEMRQGRFSFLSFYERRARRILPALLVVILVTSIFAIVVLIADELVLFGRSVFASLFFYANSFFRHQTDYFGPGADSLPLLHLWSLSVEEQFYIGFPVILLVLIRIAPRHVPPLVLAATLIFFGFSAADALKFKTGAFFLTGDRVWELLLGASAQLLPLSRPAPIRACLQQLLALAAILWSGATLGPALGLPTFEVLIPCLSAALILRSPVPTSGWAGGPLSLKGSVAIGKISYSLYLWHWPLLVSLTFLASDPTNVAIRTLTVLAAILAAAASYRFVEQPVRRTFGPVSRPKLVVGTLAGITLLSGMATLAIQTNGMRFRLGAEYDRIWAEASDVEIRHSKCSTQETKVVAPCTFGNAKAPASFLLIGDSHAGSLIPAFERMAEEHSASFEAFWSPACPPALGLFRPSPRLRNQGNMERCLNMLSTARQYIEEHNPHLIVLSLFWWHYSDSMFLQKTDANEIEITSLISRTLELLKNRQVAIVAPIPWYEFDIAREYVRFSAGLPTHDRMSMGKYLEQNQPFIDYLDGISATHRIKILQPHLGLCDARHCYAIENSLPLYLDGNHLSNFGVRKVADSLSKAMSSMWLH